MLALKKPDTKSSWSRADMPVLVVRIKYPNRLLGK